METNEIEKLVRVAGEQGVFVEAVSRGRVEGISIVDAIWTPDPLVAFNAIMRVVEGRKYPVDDDPRQICFNFGVAGVSGPGDANSSSAGTRAEPATR